jgi:hypothetical protein
LSTRGVCGFIYKGKAKLSYIEHDAVPEFVGKEFVDFFNGYSFEELVEIYNDFENYNEWLDDYPIKINNGFIKNSIFCEYAYVLNLDTKEFIVFEGFNKDINVQYELFKIEDPISEHSEYYSCKPLYKFDMNDIPTNWTDVYTFYGHYDTIKNMIDNGEMTALEAEKGFVPKYSIRDIIEKKYDGDLIKDLNKTFENKEKIEEIAKEIVKMINKLKDDNEN